jgi:hypothetical protein
MQHISSASALALMIWLGAVGCREQVRSQNGIEAASGVGPGGAASAAGIGGSGGAMPPVAVAGAGGAPGQSGSASGAGGGAGAGAGGGGTTSGTGGASGAPGDAGASDAGTDASTPPTSPWPAVTDPGAEGPYTAVTVRSSGPGGGYTVYHPQQLAPDGLRHPLLTWGNGATTSPPLFPLLPHLATHGFVVIASDNPFVTGQEMIEGIDWLIAENERSGSTFHQKLDPEQVASFGYSLGSLGTFEIADDPRIRTTVHISGGAMDKAVVPNLKNPAAFFCGDPSDIAHDNCESDFELATVPVFYGVFPGDHLGILGSHSDQITHAVTGWLRWRLMHDQTFEALFVGADCALCTGGEWTVKQKDFDVAP